jgi:AP2-like factor, ANT lineage
MAAIEHRGLNAVTNFDISRYVNLIHPNTDESKTTIQIDPDIGMINVDTIFVDEAPIVPSGIDNSYMTEAIMQSSEFIQSVDMTATSSESSNSSSASKFVDKSSTCSFPDDVQTYFECLDSIGGFDFDDSRDMTEAIMQSPKFLQSIDMTTPSSESSSSSSAPDSMDMSSTCSFPDDIQTYFQCLDSVGGFDFDDSIFRELEEFTSSTFHFDLDL